MSQGSKTEYKLPPLPYPWIPGNDYTAKDMKDYAERSVAPLLDRIEKAKECLLNGNRTWEALDYLDGKK